MCGDYNISFLFQVKEGCPSTTDRSEEDCQPIQNTSPALKKEYPQPFLRRAARWKDRRIVTNGQKRKRKPKASKAKFSDMYEPTGETLGVGSFGSVKTYSGFTFCL